MTTVNRPNRDALNRALDIFRDAMRPFIIRNLRTIQGTQVSQLISSSLPYAGRKPNNAENEIDINDFPILIRDYWRNIFSASFNSDMSVQNALWQIKDARNQAAHPAPQDIESEFTRAHLFHIADVLGKINAPEEKRAVEELRNRLFGSSNQPEAIPVKTKTDSAPEKRQAPRSAANLTPWRQVIHVNQDVARGDFQQSEFAADLQQVYDGRADSTQYGNPVSFFNHTYITPGIRALLVNTLKRLSNNGGDPVIQTKTGFGGGKTHSLIALYHLVNSMGALTNPAAQSDASERTAQMIRKIMEEAGLNADSSLDAQIAVLDCTFLSPTSSAKTENGDPLNTLWGEMAYQLGGQEAYEIVSEAARRGTAPAGQLDQLFQHVGPCAILIDELVSYVRNAADAQDNIYTFVQNLTHAVRRNRGVALVVTLPESAIEAGGQLGIEALSRLDNILGRIEATWEPLEVNEAFEVVRRRLFGNLIDPAERDRTCERFISMYGRGSSDYPQGAGDQNYLERMRDCYPIHPEIFDRLYSDWSAIPQFQRTRGVLRMMANCISRLYMNGDSSPLIMPANLTLSDPSLANEFVRLLDGNWAPVISEADRDNSRTDNIDKNVRRFADVGGAARRVARTVFLGSAPTGSVRGIDSKQIRLGVVQPGHGPSVYNDALSRMVGDLYFLYSSENRYYFHVEENLNKVAADRAGQLTDREISDEVHRIMQDAVGRRSDVIIFPQNSGEVPDTDTVRLVILPPGQSLSNRASEPNEARPQAREILQKRADAGRVHKNTLLFLVPRKDEVRQLRGAVRNYLAWSSIQSGNRRIENLEGDRRRQVTNSVRQYEAEVRSSLVNAYRWVIAPYQSNPQDSTQFDMEPSQISSTDTGQIVQSAFNRCIEEEALADSLSPDSLQSMLQQYIWNSDRDHLSVDELWGMMTSNAYMHRLRNKNVLLDCIERGVSDPTPKFGYAEGYNPDADANQYSGLRFGEFTGDGPSAIAERGHGLLINPEMARLVKEEQEELRRIEELEKSRLKGDSDTPDPSLVVDPDDSTSTVEVIDDEDSPISPATTKIIVNQTFQGEIDLNDISQLNSEIIRNLKTDGGRVTISLIVSADKPDGFSENIARSIRENCDQLGLSFEEA